MPSIEVTSISMRHSRNCYPLRNLAGKVERAFELQYTLLAGYTKKETCLVSRKPPTALIVKRVMVVVDIYSLPPKNANLT